MIRLRRIPSRIPIGRLYEIDVDGNRSATRSPVSILEASLGAGDAWSLVDEADRQYASGNRVWAVEFDGVPIRPRSRDIPAR